MRSLTSLVGLVAAVVALAACSSDADGTPTVAPPAAEGAVVVLADDRLEFDQDAYTATAGDVPFVLRNTGALPHTLVIEDSDGLDLEVRGRGDVDEASATLEPGTYTIFCDVPGHSATMRATLTVE